MNTRSRLTATSLLVMLSLTTPIPSVVSQPSQKSACPEAFPKSYREPRGTKYVKIPQLGITVRVPKDHRLVYNKEADVFTFMSPPQYTSYQCSIVKKINPEQLEANIFRITYSIHKNPKKIPLTDFINDVFFANDPINLEPSFKFNNIEFVTSKGDSSHPTTLLWFVSKSKPDAVIEYRYSCDNSTCRNSFFNKEYFKNIFNINNK